MYDYAQAIILLSKKMNESNDFRINLEKKLHSNIDGIPMGCSQ